jgi:hypothetical protein
VEKIMPSDNTIDQHGIWFKLSSGNYYFLIHSKYKLPKTANDFA